MKLHRKTRAAALMALTLATTAQADWQYTRWGMTVDEVVAASNGAAVIKDSTDTPHAARHRILTRTAEAPYEATGVTFKATFTFDEQTKGLVGVQLWVPNRADCERVLGQLRDVYGSPEVRGRMEFAWRSEQTGNVVRFNQINYAGEIVGCWVDYNPLPKAGGGL